MARDADVGKLLVWRQRMARFARSGDSVARFCVSEGVSVPTFYYWKRKLAESGSPSKMRRGGPDAAHFSFLPVELAGTAAAVECALPNGARVRVPATALRTIRAVVHAIGRLPASSAEQRSW